MLKNSLKLPKRTKRDVRKPVTRRRNPLVKGLNTNLGRNRKEVNWADFEKLCQLQCTLDEISGFFDMSPDTLRVRVKEHFTIENEDGEEVSENFATVYKRFSAVGRMSLRRAQMESAITKKNTTMQIWLGQQYLGQSNKQFTNDTDTIDGKEVEYDIRERLYDD